MVVMIGFFETRKKQQNSHFLNNKETQKDENVSS